MCVKEDYFDIPCLIWWRARPGTVRADSLRQERTFGLGQRSFRNTIDVKAYRSSVFRHYHFNWSVPDGVGCVFVLCTLACCAGTCCGTRLGVLFIWNSSFLRGLEAEFSDCFWRCSQNRYCRWVDIIRRCIWRCELSKYSRKTATAKTWLASDWFVLGIAGIGVAGAFDPFCTTRRPLSLAVP